MILLPEAHVTIYADLAAILLSFGVIVLCSRGIITDSFEGKLFLAFPLSTMLLAAVNLAMVVVGSYAVTDPRFEIPDLLLHNIQLILQIVLIAVWYVYLNYRAFRSRDTLLRTVHKRLIPLYATVGLVVVNMFTGFFFSYDADGVYHQYPTLFIHSAVVGVYFFASVIQLALHQHRFHEPKFLDLWSLVIPMLLGFVIDVASDYYTVPLGAALAVTNVYAGFINERSFLDRQTGFYNRFYMRYLRKDLEHGAFTPKSGMVFKLRDVGDMEAFSGVLRSLLEKNSVVIRYTRDTIILFEEVSDKLALHMIQEDVELGLQKLNETLPDKPVSVTVDTMFRKKKETSAEFYEQFLQKVG